MENECGNTSFPLPPARRGHAYLPLLLMVLAVVAGDVLNAAELQREQSKTTFFLHCWVPELGEPPVVDDDLRRTLHAAAQETIDGRLHSAEERMEPVMTQLASLPVDDQVLVILFRSEMLKRQALLIGGGRPMAGSTGAAFSTVINFHLIPALAGSVSTQDLKTAVKYAWLLSHVLLIQPAEERRKPPPAEPGPEPEASETLRAVQRRAVEEGFVTAVDAKIIEHVAAARFAQAQRQIPAAEREFSAALDLAPARGAFELMLDAGDLYASPQGVSATLGIDTAEVVAKGKEIRSGGVPEVWTPADVGRARRWYERAEGLAGPQNTSDCRRIALRRAALEALSDGKMADGLLLEAASGDDLTSWTANAALAVLRPDRVLFQDAVDRAAAQYSTGAVMSFVELARYYAAQARAALDPRRAVAILQMAADATETSSYARTAVPVLFDLAEFLQAEGWRLDAAISAALKARDLQENYMRIEEERIGALEGPMATIDVTEWRATEQAVLGVSELLLANVTAEAAVREGLSRLDVRIHPSPDVNQRFGALPVEERDAWRAALARSDRALRLGLAAEAVLQQHLSCADTVTSLGPLRQQVKETVPEMLREFDFHFGVCAPAWLDEHRDALLAEDPVGALRQRLASAVTVSGDVNRSRAAIGTREFSAVVSSLNHLSRLGEWSTVESDATELLSLAVQYRRVPDLLVLGSVYWARAWRGLGRPELAVAAIANVSNPLLYGYFSYDMGIEAMKTVMGAEGDLCVCGSEYCDPLSALVALEQLRAGQRAWAEVVSGIAPALRSTAEQAALEERAARGEIVDTHRLHEIRNLQAPIPPVGGFLLPVLEEVDDVIDALPPRTTVLVYAPDDEGILIWRITHETIYLTRAPTPPAELRRHSVALQNAIADRVEGQWEQYAAEVARIVLEPVEPIAAGHTVVVIAAGFLARTPFEVLPTRDGRRLGDRHPILYTDRIGKLRRDLAEADGAPFVFGMNGDGIQHAEQEALAVGRTLGVAPMTSKSLASLPETLEKMRDARYVHLATHAEIIPNRPLQSALTFGKHGALRAYEIFRDMPAAALITLSACETGAEPRGGREVEKLGESNSLLSFAFAGGARFVLASVWNAQDPNAAEIMEEFYRGMLVEQWPKARALHAAKLRLRAGRSMHPFYFANFSLVARDLAAVAEELGVGASPASN
jgi:hypothetical protein